VVALETTEEVQAQGDKLAAFVSEPMFIGSMKAPIRNGREAALVKTIQRNMNFQQVQTREFLLNKTCDCPVMLRQVDGSLVDLPP